MFEMRKLKKLQIYINVNITPILSKIKCQKLFLTVCFNIMQKHVLQ